jgi:aspartyl/glutamyl-tRNA(Asn/Gln) amidotransferase C subunit
MSITEKELEHLAVLSKLKLSPEEKKKFLNNMDSIINFLNQLKTSHINTATKEEKLRCFSK